MPCGTSPGEWVPALRCAPAGNAALRDARRRSPIFPLAVPTLYEKWGQPQSPSVSPDKARRAADPGPTRPATASRSSIETKSCGMLAAEWVPALRFAAAGNAVGGLSIPLSKAAHRPRNDEHRPGHRSPHNPSHRAPIPVPIARRIEPRLDPAAHRSPPRSDGASPDKARERRRSGAYSHRNRVGMPMKNRILRHVASRVGPGSPLRFGREC